MSNRDAATLACKVLSLYALMYAVIHLADVMGGIVSDGLMDRQTPIAFMISRSMPSILALIFASILWWWAPSIGQRMLPSGSSIRGKKDMLNADTLLAVACAAIGVYMITQTATNLVSGIAMLNLSEPGDQMYVYDRHQAFRSIGVGITEYVVGLSLIISPNRIVELIQKLRTAGTQKKHDSSEL